MTCNVFGGTLNLAQSINQEIHIYGPIQLVLSNVTLTLHRHIKPFATNMALLGPFQGHFTLVLPHRSGG